MSNWKMQVYHALPPVMRNVVASMRGYHLRRWRYGPETDALVEAALERESWSHDRWKAWQEERLAYILHRAATQVPYYRQQWTQRRRQGDTVAWDRLENWPILEKQALRAEPEAFVVDDCTHADMFHEHTSGTSGKPLDLWWSKATVQGWYAMLDARRQIGRAHV
jgi:phenylacetate-CoA ligase